MFCYMAEGNWEAELAQLVSNLKERRWQMTLECQDRLTESQSDRIQTYEGQSERCNLGKERQL